MIPRAWRKWPPSPVALALWAGAALAFAWLRIPYDDEWYSLTLLTETDGGAGFWRSLAQDRHPPWLALLDRALFDPDLGRMPLHALRVMLSAGGVACVADIARRRLGLSPRWVALAALHPIVFYYAGALRWYPALLLAHGLRHWALWADAAPARRRLALLAGACIGTAAGYLDGLFLLHDLTWWTARNPARRDRLAAAVVLAAAAAGYAAAYGLLGGHDHVGRVFGRGGGWPGVLTWAGLGPLGEAMPHVALLLLSPAVAVVGIVGLRVRTRTRDAKPLLHFLGTLCACWLLATGLGVWLPRYSLELWLWLGIGIVCALLDGDAHVTPTPATARAARTPATTRAARTLRGAGAVASLLLAVGLWATVSRTGFVKADLERLTRADCPSLLPGDGPARYVVDHHRVGAAIARECRPPAPPLQLPNYRHVPDEGGQLAGLQRAIDAGGKVTLLLTLRIQAVGMTGRRAIRLLDRRCERLEQADVVPAPHPAVRRATGRGLFRIRRISYDCGPPREASATAADAARWTPRLFRDAIHPSHGPPPDPRLRHQPAS